WRQINIVACVSTLINSRIHPLRTGYGLACGNPSLHSDEISYAISVVNIATHMAKEVLL
ncbi:unnamed protein product, partial [Arabidopsis halleri]